MTFAAILRGRPSRAHPSVGGCEAQYVSMAHHYHLFKGVVCV